MWQCSKLTGVLFCAVVPGKEVDQLVAAGYLHLDGDVAARLAAGERVMAPVQLQEVAGKIVQMASGMGGQVSAIAGSIEYCSSGKKAVSTARTLVNQHGLGSSRHRT